MKSQLAPAGKAAAAAHLNLRFAGVSTLCLLLMTSCTFEDRNKISRAVQNWTGTNGVVDVMNGGKIMHRFIQVEKLTTANATEGPATPRPYRFGYGVLDVNQNYKADESEKKVYFEVSDYSTEYVFYENPS
jgi:hypothetical protein